MPYSKPEKNMTLNLSGWEHATPCDWKKVSACTEMTSTIPLHPLKPDWDGSQNLQREKILQTVRFSKNKKQKAPPASWYDLN